ncbi:UDP-glucose 4-epimerase [Renibacterium salmoninarum ATCC 33209]|uniref:UDP-glucose 4-epimerase n=1 Tax=Renibacterium salmoninarum (strain ATCC 33209 / DSM 20767 / JCM 11484 / NBRC 15589 / NCIMB 2235) TaxID=288705 RepID=A9WPB0_RENSM|nr:UDP-glucose 4-epimerase GalE [Renibacterium salmoninarum]ABY22915.1 UDP-glucose 4-epimerase [Renibacterium salmoninarum ATCC 33209]
MKVLVTGGSGYIGSHTTLTLLEAGHEVLVLDNLVNSSEESLRRVEELTGKAAAFRQIDLLDEVALTELFSQENIDSVIHFAGLKAVGESVREPLRYYHNNVTGTINLLRAMDAHGVRNIVFSSSATVYGGLSPFPYIEKMEIGSDNPYGRTKEHIEDILSDICAADDRWKIALLRYFNPVGAHPSGRIGEDPLGIPNNLVPFIAQVAVGRRDKLMIFGGDYDTPDGTAQRDYIHVMDLAQGHVAALDFITAMPGVFRWNLGSGVGSSVLEVLHSFEKAVGHSLPYEIAARRAGDLPAFWADPSSALADLGWSTRKSLDEMCEDHWRWQKNNPNGYTA